MSQRSASPTGWWEHDAVISLRRIDHVCLRVADVDEAAGRWALQFGLTERSRDQGRTVLSCDDEPYCLELINDPCPGLDHVGYELSSDCELEQARAHLEALGVAVAERADGLHAHDAEGNGVQILPYREPPSRLVAHARPAGVLPVGHPRKLGHVNFLTGAFGEQLRFYHEALGMRITDYLGDGGVWLHVNSDHHVMALVDKGAPHFHHLAFDVVDIGQMRDMLDHVGRHGRWLGWGPTRHGVGGNIASYVRIVEEECFVELYCDMEQLQADHQPRRWADDRFSSNTWGPLPPRSYFRFDRAAVDSERESLEMLGVPLPPPPSVVGVGG
jgi:catechol-2,3-dioxygenase